MHIKKLPMDLETPVSAFYKLAPMEPLFLLESVDGGELIGRYSFIGLRALYRIDIQESKITIRHRQTASEIEYGESPFPALRNITTGLQNKFFVEEEDGVEQLPRLKGGLVGLCSYDLIRHIEKLPDTAKDTTELPLGIFYVPEIILAFDNMQKDIKVITFGTEEDAKHIMQEIKTLFNKNISINNNGTFSSPVANHETRKFYDMVNRAREYILSGDAYQIVLSLKFKGEATVNPFQVYRALRMINPSPYMYYLNFGDMQIVGSSPEVLVRVEDNEIMERPIAGTRRRGKNKAEDMLLAQELLMNEKEKAEHIMLVDLARNDIGRIAIPSTESVKELMKIEKFSHVMHMVSMVTGKLSNEHDIFDVFKATFPAGTVTGAPKIRAMEIIEELEEEKRGPYAGSVGYFAFNNTMDQAINIRSILFAKDTYTIQAGAGILADSVPEKEYEEITNKAKALFSAMELSKEL